MTGARARPFSVSRYSTYGGVDGTTVRDTSFASSKSRSRSVSMRGEIPSIASTNSLKRSAPLIAANRIERSQRRSRRSAARRTSSGTGGHLRQRGIERGLQREIENLVHGHDRVEAHLLADLGGDVVEVAAVALGQHHVGEPGRVGGQHLLL